MDKLAIQVAANALRKEARWLEYQADSIEHADDVSELATLWRRLNDMDRGKIDAEGQSWARTQIKDAIQKEGYWDDENNQPNYDEL